MNHKRVPVSDGTIQQDLKLLLAVLNWAARSRDEQGRLLLDSDPLKGLKTPTEKNPARIVLAEEEYQALLQVSRHDWRFHVALVLAHETGHRRARIKGCVKERRRTFPLTINQRVPGCHPGDRNVAS